MTRTYLVECYWPNASEAQLKGAIERARRFEDSQRRNDVRWVDSVLIPADDIVLCVFEGSSADAVRAIAGQAGLPAERIVECVQVVTGSLVTKGNQQR